MSSDRHLRASLVCVATFLAVGLWLEAMYGLRAGGWIDDDLRREFLRLGHAHGASLAVLNVGLAWAIERLRTPAAWARRIRVAALAGVLLVSGGFVGGGLWHGLTDPGPLVLVVPAGAMMLLAAVVAVILVRPEERRGQPPDGPKMAGLLYSNGDSTRAKPSASRPLRGRLAREWAFTSRAPARSSSNSWESWVVVPSS